MRHSLWQSFRFAGRGLRTAFWTQRTVRTQVVLGCAVALSALWLDLPPAQVAVIVLAVALVLGAELMNTAIEAVVDLQVGERRHFLAGRAKDLAAAAVLVVASGAVGVGLLTLAPPILHSIGGGRIGPLAVARIVTLLGILALAAVVLSRSGGREGQG